MSEAPVHAFRYSAGRLRLGEFDLGGVLYHANYFHLYESAREALLQSIDSPYSLLVAEGAHLVIVESYQSFYQPVTYGEEVDLLLWCEDLRRSSVRFHYEIISETSKKSAHLAWTRQAFVRKQEGTFRPERFPERLLSGLRSVLRGAE